MHYQWTNDLLTFFLLTYMTTIAEALKRGALEEFALPNWEAREPMRPMLVAPALFDWVDSKVELYDGSIVEGARTPLEHLEQFFCDMRCSARPAAGDLRRLTPTKHGIWKAHPPTLRIYGWFHKPLCFVAVAGALTIDTKSDSKLNDSKRKFVLEFIKSAGLQKSITYGDHRAVFQAPN